MGEIATQTASTALANIDALLASRAATILDNVKAGGKFISLNNRQFNLPGGEVVKGDLDLIILDYAFHNHYYPDPYQAGTSSGVACYSIGTDENNMVIGEDAAEPVHTDCRSCPNNQWGSAGQGRKGKACANNIMLAVMFPDPETSTDVMVIKASPSASGGIKQYLTNATRMYGHPLKALTTASIAPAGGGFKLVLEVSGENPHYQLHAQHLDAAHDAVMAPPAMKELEFAPAPGKRKAKD